MLFPRVVFADDLTGAAECAAAFLPRTVRIRWDSVASSSAAETRVTNGDERHEVTVVDTDSRNLPADEAGQRLRSALAHEWGRPGRTPVLKKLDSTLRGPIAAEIAALRDSGLPVIVAPALPAGGRTVVDGRVEVDGRPLAECGAWAAEPRPAPASVAAALAPVPTVEVPLSDVRRQPGDLAAALRSAVAAGAVAVCDAATEADLDRIAYVGDHLDGPVAWAGSAGLAYALARAGGGSSLESAALADPGDPAGSREPPLFVLGTASPAARRQIAALAGSFTSVELYAGELTDRSAPPAMAELVAGRPAVVYVGGNAGPAGQEPRRSPEVAAGLARSVAPALGSARPLFLSGGETARAVLDLLGVPELLVHATWEPGVVACTTPEGRQIVTKPGDFGDDATLARIANRLSASTDAKGSR